MKSKLTQWLNHFWYSIPTVPLVLKPLSLIYWIGHRLHRYIRQPKPTSIKTPPVIVVGNITVGGTGKTPFLIELAHQMQNAGYTIGIVTRGYQNKLSTFPHLVKHDDPPILVGDEAALIAKKVNAPLVISPHRQKAVEFLATQYSCDFILSDDGLQHYGMHRAMEIVMVDGQRGFGNAHLLPIGPLRESLSRLNHVDFIIMNGQASASTQKKISNMNLGYYNMALKPLAITPPLPNSSEKIAAFAGIGHPERFFQTLCELGIPHTPYSFADHHQFSENDFEIPETCIIMTEKDGIKCKNQPKKSIHVLPVVACMTNDFWRDFFSHPLFQTVRPN